MQMPNTYFEQIPVESVKKIAELHIVTVNKRDDSPVDIAIHNDWGKHAPARTKSGKTWQDIARAVSQETDPFRMVELCRELNEALLAEEEVRHSRLALVRSPDESITSGHLEI